jgi:hypothetical protein
MSIRKLYLSRLVRAKARIGLPYAGLFLYYAMFYLYTFRWLRSARSIGELLHRLFGTNFFVNQILASVYRQMWDFQKECKTLMSIVSIDCHDIDLLTRAGETAAYAEDADSLERLRNIVAQGNPSFLSYLNGLLGYLNGQANYHVHFKESVRCFLSLEGVDPPDSSGKSMSILMKRTLKSERHIPEFVRVAYNIRDLASIDELPMVDIPSQTRSSLPNVPNGTSISGLGPTDPFVLISCSDGYLNVFGDYYIRVFRRKNQNIIHFHVLADDVETTRDYLVTLKEKYSNIRYSIEAISGESQTYITLARFLICRDLMKHYNRDALISDLDFHPDFNLQPICSKFRSQGFDFGLCDAGYSVPWAKFSVGFSYFRVGNHATDVYLDLLSRHLVVLYSDGGFFSMDQIGALLIYEYMVARGDNFKMLNLYSEVDFRGLFSVPKKLQRGKVKVKFGAGAPK